MIIGIGSIRIFFIRKRYGCFSFYILQPLVACSIGWRHFYIMDGKHPVFLRIIIAQSMTTVLSMPIRFLLLLFLKNNTRNAIRMYNVMTSAIEGCHSMTAYSHEEIRLTMVFMVCVSHCNISVSIAFMFSCQHNIHQKAATYRISEARTLTARFEKTENVGR